MTEIEFLREEVAALRKEVAQLRATQSGPHYHYHYAPQASPLYTPPPPYSPYIGATCGDPYVPGLTGTLSGVAGGILGRN